MTPLQGCGTALVTPFTTDGSVDFPALRSLVDWQIAEGIDFLVACGSTGEAQTLDGSEREAVVAAVIEAADRRVPVMAGATSNHTAPASHRKTVRDIPDVLRRQGLRNAGQYIP